MHRPPHRPTKPKAHSGPTIKWAWLIVTKLSTHTRERVGEPTPINKPIPVNKKFNYQLLILHFTPKTMPISSEKEETLLLNALEAYKSGQFKSIQSAAAHYGVSKWKLRNRKDGRTNGKGRTATRKVLN